MKKNLQSAFNQRQFMVKKDFEIYYYSDTCPLTIAPHTHPCYEFYFFLEGNASYTIKKTSYPLQFGDFLVVPPASVITLLSAAVLTLISVSFSG